jgi:hypothetical protein
MRRFVVLALATLACGPLAAQVTPYGSPSPAPFAGTFHSGGQVPVVGNFNFKLALNDPNVYGGGLGIGFAPTSVPFGSATLLVDLAGGSLFTLPAGVTEFPIAVPNIPALAGYTAYVQAGVFDPALPGGFGLTNAIRVTVMPDRSPRRAYIPGQNFSGAPGLMTVLDVSVQPPVFRATGSVGFPGTISNNFPTKIAVADVAGIAYALGHSANQFVRAFNVAADPAGVVAHVSLGDIPTAGAVGAGCGERDVEVTSNGHYLFVTSGGSNALLEVFDCSTMPGTLPASAVQTIAFNGVGNVAVVGLELSPADDRLAVLVSHDSAPAISIYDLIPGAVPPLVLFATVPLAGLYPGQSTPQDVHFTPDGQQLFVSGADGVNGFFSVIDVTTSPPSVLIPGNYWNPVSGYLWFHGSAVALMNGVPVALLAGEGVGASYTLIDLNPTAPTFGSVITTFTTNPGGEISNHRMHGRGSIVVAVDGSGALSTAHWIDVIDLNQPNPPGFAFWRVRLPTQATLTPASASGIPRDFDLF